MKQLTCEMCGSTDLMKQDGVFVCQSCGCKYSVEEAKKMMVEGTVDVQGTVKVDTSGELANLYQLARRAKDNDNGENAVKYYEMILLKDPNSWEAAFYVVYFKAIEFNIAQIDSAGISVAECIDTVLKLIKDNVANKDEQKEAYTEVANRVIIIARMLFNAGKNKYDKQDNVTDKELRYYYKKTWLEDAVPATNCAYILGNNLDLLFKTDSEANNLSVTAWKQGVAWHSSLIDYLADKDVHRQAINDYVAKIQQYDSSYTAPQESTAAPQENTGAPQESTGGCYVATAVYGSYDCPQVWTLRRFRDYTLAETWYGRAFIRMYYAVSPTFVEWFGHTKWFKKMWKGKLDRMVENLKADGVEDTPYTDKNW